MSLFINSIFNIIYIYMKTFTNKQKKNKPKKNKQKIKNKKKKLSPFMNFILNLFSSVLGIIAMSFSFVLMGVNLLSLYITFS